MYVYLISPLRVKEFQDEINLPRIDASCRGFSCEAGLILYKAPRLLDTSLTVANQSAPSPSAAHGDLWTS